MSWEYSVCVVPAEDGEGPCPADSGRDGGKEDCEGGYDSFAIFTRPRDLVGGIGLGSVVSRALCIAAEPLVTELGEFWVAFTDASPDVNE